MTQIAERDLKLFNDQFQVTIARIVYQVIKRRVCLWPLSSSGKANMSSAIVLIREPRNATVFATNLRITHLQALCKHHVCRHPMRACHVIELWAHQIFSRYTHVSDHSSLFRTPLSFSGPFCSTTLTGPLRKLSPESRRNPNLISSSTCFRTISALNHTPIHLIGTLTHQIANPPDFLKPKSTSTRLKTLIFNL